jgi:hypothetical protein
MLNFRAPPDLINDIECWVAAQTEPQPTRSDAIRQLVKIGLLASAGKPAPSLDEQIARQGTKIADPGQQTIAFDDLNASNDE